MTPAVRDILTNREVIAIDQDPLGAEATRLSEQGNADVWVKQLANGDRAIMLLNRGRPAQHQHHGAGRRAARRGRLPRAQPVDAHDERVCRCHRRLGAANERRLFTAAPLHGPLAGPLPLTDVAVSVPACTRVLTYQVAGPGQTITVPATFRNDGRTAITDARLSLNAPAGWTVTGTPPSRRSTQRR